MTNRSLSTRNFSEPLNCSRTSLNQYLRRNLLRNTERRTWEIIFRVSTLSECDDGSFSVCSPRNLSRNLCFRIVFRKRYLSLILPIGERKNCLKKRTRSESKVRLRPVCGLSHRSCIAWDANPRCSHWCKKLVNIGTPVTRGHVIEEYANPSAERGKILYDLVWCSCCYPPLVF